MPEISTIEREALRIAAEVVHGTGSLRPVLHIDGIARHDCWGDRPGSNYPEELRALADRNLAGLMDPIARADARRELVADALAKREDLDAWEIAALQVARRQRRCERVEETRLRGRNVRPRTNRIFRAK